MFRPRDSYDQKLIAAELKITPEPANVRWIHDVFGNCVALVRFSGRSEELRFESRIRLEHTPANIPDFEIEEAAKTFPFAYDPDEMPDLQPAMTRQYLDRDGKLHDWVQGFLSRGRVTKTGELLMTLTHAIKEGFVYERRSEPGTRDPALTLKLGRGSCRDLALLMMEAVRSLGFAARFVSGYLYVPSRDARRRLGGGSTHAWCQIYIPGAGWIEFDPTNGIVGNHDLIRVAVARDPSQAVPLSGTWHGSSADSLGMEVEVQVRGAIAKSKSSHFREKDLIAYGT